MSRQLSALRSVYNVGIWPRSCNKISAYDRCPIRRLLSTSTDNGASESVIQNDSTLPRVFVCQRQYQSIMKYYVNKGDVDSVERIMVEMNRGGIPPNLTTINMLLSAYAAKKDGLGAQVTFDEMQKLGIVSNNQTLGILMNAYANQGDFTAVDKVLHDATAATDANLGIK
jgi:pentatricopeptide repeat protein